MVASGRVSYASVEYTKPSKMQYLLYDSETPVFFCMMITLPSDIDADAPDRRNF